MAIVIYVTDGHGGYGDFLFALKAAAGLKAVLAKSINYTDEIFLVTQQAGKDKITEIGGNEEFGIIVLSEKEYANIRKNPNFHLDYFIEGPVFSCFSHTEYLQEKTPVLLISEYSVKCPAMDGIYSNEKRSVLTINTGFGHNEHGIFLTDYLIKATKEKQQGNMSFRAEAYKDFSPNMLHILHH